MSMSRGTSRSRGRSRSRDGSRGREGSRGRKRSRRSRSRGRGRGRSRSRRWSRSSRSRCMYMRGLFSEPILCKTGPGGPGAAGGPPLPLTPAPVLTLPAPCQPSILYLDRLVSGQAVMTAGLGPTHLTIADG